MKKKGLVLLFSVFLLFCHGQSPQCISNTTNGSFELPSGCSSFCMVDASTVSEWYTSATDNTMEIWQSGFMGVPAYLGNQFVELNANEVSTLYQDICTPCPTTINWSFAHRGRQGTDVLALKAGPPGGPYTQEGVFSDGNSAWGVYSGTYTIPSGQTITRILFESVSSTGGSLSVGNFLDAVSFSFVPIEITVNSATICAGQTAVLTAAGGTSYSWSGGEITNSITVSPSATASYTVIGTSDGVCSDTAVATVTVNPLPVITVNSATICAGQTAVLTAWGGTTYSWSSGETSTSISISPTATSSYTVTGTTGNGCSDSAIAIVTVIPLPIITVNSATICTGQTAILTAGGATTYSWSSGEISTSISVSPAAATSYTVTGINNGCSDSAIASIVINASPIITVNSATICIGSVGTLTATGATIYLWNTGATTNSITVAPLADTSFTVIGLTNGCSDTAVSTVIVRYLPNADFSTTNVCDGSIMPFNDLSTIPSTDTIQSWKWDFGDGSPDYNQNTLHQYPTYGSYTVQLLVISNFGCMDSITKTCIVNPNPTALFTASDTIGCEPLCVGFQDLSYISTGSNVQWAWNVGDGSLVNNSQTFDHCYSNDSVYAPNTFNVTFTVTSDSGCVSTITKNNYITVYPNPNASFAVQPQTTTLSDPIISITDLSAGADLWNWNFGDTYTSIVSNPSSHVYADTGSYTVTLITSTQYGCVSTAFKNIIIEPDFIFYVPNAFTPDGDGINDSFTGKGLFIKSFEMSIFDRWGNLIFYSNHINKPWDGKAKQGTEMAQGDVYVYSIKLTDLKNGKHYYKGIVTLAR